jgi:hypothetical protein
MKLAKYTLKSLNAFVFAAGMLVLSPTVSRADNAEAADRAFEMASKYAAMGYYLAPSKEGKAGFGVTLEFEVPVNRGLDYVFVVAGDKYCQDVDIWIEAEETGNTLVKDTRRINNALAGVRWRSDYNGVVTVVVNFARVTSRCSWAAVAGRRGTANNPEDQANPPGRSAPVDNGQAESRANSAVNKVD